MSVKPLIAVTMGDPAGIGPELIHLAFMNESINDFCKPVVIGDEKILEKARECTKSNQKINPITCPEEGIYKKGIINLINTGNSDIVEPGIPTKLSGRAMIEYIEYAIDLAKKGIVKGVVTCPINKAAMQLAQSEFHGHTELFAKRTDTKRYKMMMAGDRLKVVLVTIHISLMDAVKTLSKEMIVDAIEVTDRALKDRFGIKKPVVAVAGLNPHAGEDGLFGDEENTIIEPAVNSALKKGIVAKGPYPPDTIYFNAAKGDFDAVISMYHDQGLIPFKMIHFEDGVNTTLGLPIIRTSVDHGTAYDIAGKGIANSMSLISAIKMAALQAENLE